MAQKFKTRSIFCRTGFFEEGLVIGANESNQVSGLYISGRDFTISEGDININSGNFVLKSGIAYFDSKPIISGIPVLLSGEVEPPDLSDYIQIEQLSELSGSLNSKIYQETSLLSAGLLQSSGSLQNQINNLNISANGASIVSDYSNGVSYVGRALVGSSESDPVWTIKKIQLTASGTVSGSVLKSTNSPWSGRYSLNYQ
jgi:hypothetical protein